MVMLQTAGEELFTDSNGNGRRDAGKPPLDLNENGGWDATVTDYALTSGGHVRVEPSCESCAEDGTRTAPNGSYDALATIYTDKVVVWVNDAPTVQWMPRTYYEISEDGCAPNVDPIIFSATNAITATALSFGAGVSTVTPPAQLVTQGAFLEIWAGDDEEDIFSTKVRSRSN